MQLFLFLSFIRQFSSSVVFHSLRSHGLQHARPPCPSPTPSLLKLMSVVSAMTSSNHLILCRPLLLLSSIFPSIMTKPIYPLGPQAGLLHDRLRPLRSSEDKQLAQGHPASDTQAYPLQPLSLKPPPNSPPLPRPSMQKGQILL